jgi:hypothetical protein
MRNNFTASTVRLSTYCLISLVIVLFGGCRSAEKYFYNADKYTYKNTRQTYAHLACNYKEESEISAASTSAPCSTDQPLSLKKAVEIAQANNPDINMATARIHQARALMQLARAPFYPFVKFYT